MILELGVKLMERGFPDGGVALDEEGGKGALGEGALDPFFIGQHAEFHIDVGELGEGLVMPVDDARAEGHEALFRLGKGVRTHPADFAEADIPIGEVGIGEEGGELRIVDGLDFRRDERGGFADLGEEVVELAGALQVIGVRAVLGHAEGGVMVQALDAEAEDLVELEAIAQAGGGLADLAAEPGITRVLGLETLEIGGPIGVGGI